MDVLDLIQGKEAWDVELVVGLLFYQGDWRDDLSLRSYLGLESADRSYFTDQAVSVHLN